MTSASHEHTPCLATTSTRLAQIEGAIRGIATCIEACFGTYPENQKMVEFLTEELKLQAAHLEDVRPGFIRERHTMTATQCSLCHTPLTNRSYDTVAFRCDKCGMEFCTNCINDPD